MYESNIGQTIKSVVSVLCVIGIIACVIAGIALISQGLGAIGWPVMLVGAFSMAITYLFLYGFGELVDKTCENNAAMLRIEKELEALKQKNGEESRPAAAPEKGPAKAQVAPRELISKEMMSAMQGMKSATEIYDYLSQKLDKSDEAVRELLKAINDIAVSEETYGNDLYNALRKIKLFVEHGCRVFAVDRSAPTMICPACGKEQNTNRAVCSSCGALFRK
ncbi:MAG TPA: hypothetical protein IAA71_08980 [Candidatus Pullichristensenella stercoripullorum]|nr:hypothetical protein [Candidatus Pullichristensenella stercoripullorum]